MLRARGKLQAGPATVRRENGIIERKTVPRSGEQVQHFSIISALGSGGMGQVFLAEDTKLQRRAALKFLSPELASDPEHRNRFLREARSSSNLNHPNICTIYGVDDSSEEPFIAMEYVEGETLALMIHRRHRGLRQGLAIATQVADALIEAHAKGIVHRDIKPANIIVDKKDRVKVLDFGLAKQIRLDPALKNPQFETNAGVILGTVSYMSPEQARGLDIDHRTDIWSLGVCIYQTITGVLPFKGETSADTIAAILTLQPPKPSELVLGIPSDVDELVLRALNKKREDRFRTAGEMLEALRSVQTRLIGIDAPARQTSDIQGDETTEVFEAPGTGNLPTVVTDGERVASAAVPNNLTSSFVPIIGRGSEINAVCALLHEPDRRLITLTGIGGTGKTTLARAVANEALSEFRDGVYFIEMASVSGPETVAARIAQPLGVREEGSTPIIEALKQHLRKRKCLLVIDNFEQIVEAAPVISDLLNAASELRVIVTSRELLRVSAEIEFPVPPLAVPSLEDRKKLDEIAGNEAIRLFAERAEVANPGFRLTIENVAEVSAICRRLDGLPLAIELAAARTKVLSPASILAKLDNRLDLLSGGDRDRPERQQTMRGALMWSFDLLTEPERRAFAALSIFEGGFRLDAAEAVCPDETAPNAPLLIDILSSLIDKSLVTRRRSSGQEPRFRMLEVVRDFAGEMLAADGKKEAVSLRHAEFFVKLGEIAEPLLQGSESEKWLKRLEEDHENIRAAMAWSIDRRTDLALRLAVGVRNYWIVHNHLSEGVGWLKAVAEAVSDPPPALQFKLLNGLGLAARFRGDLPTSRRAYEEGLKAGISAGDQSGTALSHRGLGLVSMQSGDLVTARKHFDAGLEISRKLEDQYGIAMSLTFLGDLCRTEESFTEAVVYFEESVELFRRLENKTAVGDVLNNLGAALVCLGQFDKAEPNFREALRSAFNMQNRITMSHSIDGLAAIALEKGDSELAASLSGAADHLREQVGYHIEPAEARFRSFYLSKLTAAISNERYLELAAKGKLIPVEDLAEFAAGGSVETEKPTSVTA
ncbi:MAG TPA: protein kinase [Pyrinomonadaceae bacterium]|nr:protein kinase [Pyrinomonadaceae bacterium]